MEAREANPAAEDNQVSAESCHFLAELNLKGDNGAMWQTCC